MKLVQVIPKNQIYLKLLIQIQYYEYNFTDRTGRVGRVGGAG